MKKLFISADIEGTAGIVNWNETERSVPHDYDYFANQMTREVAAAISCSASMAFSALLS